jgi:phage terminase large subunit GpA-like protein
MGFLTSAERLVAGAISQAMAPPVPPDITQWCTDNIEFDDRSPLPGRFNIARFPFLKEIHEVLSPEHHSREVTLRGSAQFGKTVSVIQPTLGSWHEAMPLDSLVVHPTHSAATEWVNNKWMPMRRTAPSLMRIFGDGIRAGQRDNTLNQETLDRTGSLRVTSSGSPSDLTGTTRRLIILDDLSKFETSEKGDPEYLAVSRADGFDEAKILRISTAMVKGTCRNSAAYDRSDQRLFHVPCPSCGQEQPLTWENFVQNIDPERLAAAHFTCEFCKEPIRHGDKAKIVGLGRWVSHNPRGDHPGFHLWRAYVPQRDWASIATYYAQVMGWTRIETGSSRKVDHETDPTAERDLRTEQVFWNDVLGLPYEQATDAPDWTELRDRTEKAEPGDRLPRGMLPSTGFIYAAGVDCQLDRTEVHFVAFGRNRRRWTIDYKVIPHFIGDRECREQLNAYLRQEWRTQLGLPVALDILAIDGGTYTDDVWSWAKTHPWSRVIIVKGGSSQTGPLMAAQKFERRKDGKAKRAQKRAFVLNVSQLKGGFYTNLRKEDPAKRGYVQFALGLGDEFYRMISSETRKLVRNSSGVTTSRWDLVEPARRNEALDNMNYAEAGAMRKGWHAMTDGQWDQLDFERSAAPAEAQADLFDGDVPVVKNETRPAPPKRRKLSEVLNDDAD